MTLYSWGANSYGQLGLNHCNDECRPQKLFKTSSKITAIAAGGGHTVFCTEEDGTVWGCGSNSKGQIGLPTSRKSASVMTLLSATFASPVVHISCGWEHTLITLASGTAVGFGCNKFGQLGSDPAKIQSSWQPVVILLKNVTRTECGVRHSMALDVDGNVFCWGDGKRGQLGRQNTDNFWSPERVRLNCVVADIAAGQYHSACLAKDGNVYVWGSNKHGQLGCQPVQLVETWQPTLVKSDAKFVRICSGWSHLLACDEQHQLYCWGRANYGQTGNSECLAVGYSEVPRRLDMKSLSTSSFSCGSEHCLAVSDGTLFSWGWNEHGMCGVGSQEEVIRKPTEVQLPNCSGSCIVVCGAGHSLAYCS